MPFNGKVFELRKTVYEWQVLDQIAGDEKKLKAFLNSHIHNLCDNVHLENPMILCPDCTKSRRAFYVPEHLLENFQIIMERYQLDPATIINNFILSPLLQERHFKIYGY